MERRSNATLMGLPLLHIATGEVRDGRYHRGVARGWIAIGDIAYGVLFAAGGISVGGIAFGGAAIGVVTFAGVSLGLLALGGLGVGGVALGGAAVGVIGLGGAAIGGYAALGGAAIAGQYAVGGAAIAPHANDAAARRLFESGPLWLARSALENSNSIWLAMIPVLLIPILFGSTRPQPKPEPTGWE